MNRKIRMGMVGGGKESMIGHVHRIAACVDNRVELVCGAFSTTRQRSVESGVAFGLAESRSYGTYREMLRREAKLPEGERMDFVAIVTPNNMHYPVAMAAVDAGFHILCERPMTTSMDEALNLQRKLQAGKRLFCLTHNIAGYPMVREARQTCTRNKLGNIRRVVVECPQGWLATRLETAGHKQAGWRTDPKRSGQGGCIADVGAAAIHLAEYVTGLEITEVCADLHTFIAGRPVDDDGSVLLRFSNGARGVLWVSHVAIGEENALRLRVYGDKGGLDWQLDDPDRLLVTALDAPAELRRSGGPGISKPAADAAWLPTLQPQGQILSYANVYRAFLDELEADLEGRKLRSPPEYPRVEDGIRVMGFVEAALRSARAVDEKWEELKLEVVYPQPLPTE